MNEDLNYLNKVSLFRGIKSDDILKLLSCLNARTESYQKKDVIMLEGQSVSSVGVVLSGKAQIVKEDFFGNRNIIAEVQPYSIFAEAFSCAKFDKLPVTVLCAADCKILWIDFNKIISTCTSACKFHSKLIENMLTILASKNILLSQKIEHISKRTMREKLLSYLSDQSLRQGSYEFEIPFNRQELADYLCVDRSALSSELSKLQSEGVLQYHLNHFILKNLGTEN